MKRSASLLFLFLPLTAPAQEAFTPEILWSLKRVSADAVSPDGRYLYYTTRQTDVAAEKTSTQRYKLSIQTGQREEWKAADGLAVVQREGATWWATQDDNLMRSTDGGKNWVRAGAVPEGADNIRVSPDGRWIAFSREVLVEKLLGTDRHPDLPKTSAQVYTDLNYRHWDTWEDGKYSHVFITAADGSGEAKDLLEGLPYDAPQKPFGGTEDIVWRPDSKGLVYVCKKKSGIEYAASTNTDLYYYDLATSTTQNWTEGMMGYDTNPVFSPDGKRIAWLSMARDGFESDKARLAVMDVDRRGAPRFLTGAWDETVASFLWTKSGDRILFTAPSRGTEQLFEVAVPRNLAVRSADVVRQITRGPWDITGIAGEAADGEIVVSRTDHNHAAELFAVSPRTGVMEPLTDENLPVYRRLQKSRSELKMVTTTDGKQMGVWVVYPPGFDSTKKYPVLLYCQGGPQSALSQFFSFRWNFRLMAAQGYVVVAPNRRGMPGWGTAWNEQISKDWGGQAMRDYLSAYDAIARQPWADTARAGCVGASYGGYSVFMLAGMHGGRFKSFIAHDGLFDLRSWYGTTEELWFANWDIGGPYWGKNPPRSYRDFNPSNFVDRWTAPIMVIQGGTDYRVGIEQGLQAFAAAKGRGLKSKLLYLPDENHWVLRPQNAIVWQREFFSWLDETLR